MFIHYRTIGFILKKENREEADQLFTIYTNDFGKIEVVGKAIRKIKSKLRPGMETFCLSEIEFIQGKAHKTLTDAILIEKFKNFRKDLKKIAIARKISEVFNDLVKEQESDIKIWQLLIETFQLLNTPNLKSTIYNLQYYFFLWNLFAFLGYQPELYNCILCQKKLIPGKIYFDPKEGGVICLGCFEKTKEKSLAGRKHSIEINPDIVKILRIILKKDWSILSRLKIDSFHQKALGDISASFFLAISHLK